MCPRGGLMRRPPTCTALLPLSRVGPCTYGTCLACRKSSPAGSRKLGYYEHRHYGDTPQCGCWRSQTREHTRSDTPVRLGKLVLEALRAIRSHSRMAAALLSLQLWPRRRLSVSDRSARQGSPGLLGASLDILETPKTDNFVYAVVRVLAPATQ